MKILNIILPGDGIEEPVINAEGFTHLDLEFAYDLLDHLLHQETYNMLESRCFRLASQVDELEAELECYYEAEAEEASARRAGRWL